MKSYKEMLTVLLMMGISGLAGFAFYHFVIAPRSEINYIETTSTPLELEKLNASSDNQTSDEIDLTSLVTNDMQSKPVTLDQRPDKTLVINFWATWCPPCRKEIPLFIQAQENYIDKDVQFLGIAMDDPKAVAKYMEQAGFNYPILISDMNETIRIGQAFDYNFIALPFTIFVSADRKTSKAHTGELNAAELESLLQTFTKAL